MLSLLIVELGLLAAPAPSPQEINRHSPCLHLLDRQRISEGERRPWHPEELVAILGQQRGRHWGYIDGMCYSLDGKQIACLAAERIYVWEASSLRFQTLLPIKATYIRFVPQNNALLTCSADGNEGGTARLWDVSKAKPTMRQLLRGSWDTFSLAGTAVSSDGKKLVAKTGSTIDLYDLSTSPPTRSTLPLTDDLSSVAISPDSRMLATITSKTLTSGKWDVPYGVANLKITLWDISDRQPKEFCVLARACREWDRLTFSSDGKTLVAGEAVWDLSQARPRFRATMPDQIELLQPCVFHPNGLSAITTYIKDRKMQLCVRDMRPRIPKIRDTVPLAAPFCSALALSPSGNTLAVGENNSLNLLPIRGGKIQAPLPAYGHLGDVTSLSFGACGNLLATASKDATLRLWDLDGPRPHHRLVLKGELNPWGGDANPWDSIALSPDGTKLATASQKRGLTIWNVTAKGLRILAEHKCGDPTPPKQRPSVPTPPPISLAFTLDSKTLFLADGANPVKIIDLSKPSAIAAELKSGPRFIFRNIAKPVPFAGQVDFPPESETFQVQEPLQVYALAVSPDGQTLALRAYYEIEIWQRKEEGWNRKSGFWYTFASRGRPMAFERSGKVLLVGSGDGEVRRFNVGGEKPVQLGETVVRKAAITSVAASSNGHFLAAADRGGRVVVWSANMAKKLHEWNFPGPVHCVSFAPDGRHLALGNGDGTVYILRLAVPAEK